MQAEDMEYISLVKVFYFLVFVSLQNRIMIEFKAVPFGITSNLEINIWILCVTPGHRDGCCKKALVFRIEQDEVRVGYFIQRKVKR